MLFIDDYFSCFCENTPDNQADKQIILQSICNPNNFKKFIGIGIQSPYADSPYQRFLQDDKGDEIGISMSCCDEHQAKRIRHFVERFAWPQLTAYYAHSSTPFGKYQARTTCKVLSTQAMAHLLELNNYIPHSEYYFIRVITETGERLFFGNLMQPALGICAMDILPKQRFSIITPSFYRALCNVNLLDVICREPDHSPNNYNVVLNGSGLAIGVSMYDNNGLGTFSLNTNIAFETLKKCSPIVTPDGYINRPYLDKSLVEKILSLRFSSVFSSLSPHLGIPAIFCTWRRIVALKYAIRSSIASSPSILESAPSFLNISIERELNGTYGKTYLLSFLQDCQYRSQYR